MSHTPGPWHWMDGFADPFDKYADCRLVSASGVEIIPIRGDHHEPIWDTNWPNSDDDPESDDFSLDEITPCKADRDVIAAAPELLEALEEAVEHTLKNFGPGDVLDKARAAIAKARGEA